MAVALFGAPRLQCLHSTNATKSNSPRTTAVVTGQQSPPALRRQCVVRSSPDEDNISETLKADLDRMRRQEGSTPSGTSSGISSDQEQGQQSPFSSLKEGVDKVLIADFFVVLGALAWLGVGVLQAKLSDSGSSPLLDVWFPLWPTLWQSAIGLLMAGALVSGGLKWLSSKSQGSK